MRTAQKLCFVLEQNWGPVGERLRDSKTISDIRNAFCQVRGVQCSRLDLFTRSQTRRSNGTEIRKLRKELQQTRKLLYEASVGQRYARDWYKKAYRDRAAEPDESRKQELELACAEWLAKSGRADASRAEIDKSLEMLSEKLRSCEAYFAQSEILVFVQSGRREFTPFNVAAAMAGIPHLSARMSCQRVWSMKPPCTKGHAYLMFSAINANFSQWPRNRDHGIERMRDYLVARQRNKLPHIKELRKNWYFLSLAIRSSIQKPRGTRGSLPYRIFAEYMSRSSCQGSGDSVLAETCRILIPGERPELEGLPSR